MKTILLQEFLDQYPPLYPHDNPTWKATVEYMLGDELEQQTVNELILDYQRDGHFRRPPVVGERNNPDEGNFVVINGTHRVVTLILVGASHITYSWVDDPENVEEEQNPIRVTVQTTESDEDDEVFADFLFDGLRSIHISSSEWVTADYSFGGPGKCELFYEGIFASKENVRKVEEAVLKRLTDSPYSERIVSVIADEYSYAEDDD